MQIQIPTLMFLNSICKHFATNGILVRNFRISHQNPCLQALFKLFSTKCLAIALSSRNKGCCKGSLGSVIDPIELSGPFDRLNAILSLLHPLDRYRTPSAIGSAIGRPLSRPISHPNTGGSPQPPRSKPLGGLNRAIVVL